MVRKSKVISCSISEEQETFLKDSGFSPSDLLQLAINQKKESLQVEKKELERKVNNLTEVLSDYIDYLHEIDKVNEFHEWRNKKHGN